MRATVVGAFLFMLMVGNVFYISFNIFFPRDIRTYETVINKTQENMHMFDHDHNDNITILQFNATIHQNIVPEGLMKVKVDESRQNMILFYKVKFWEEGILDSNDPFDKCSKRCRISLDRRDSARADVLIIQADLITDNSLPAKKPNQIWVYSNFESPITLAAVSRPFVFRENVDKFKRKFNWTMGYRRDADFTVTHGRFKVREEKSEEYLINLNKLMKTKTKTAVWFVSHCQTYSGRLKFGRMLQNYTHLDIFGTCGKILKNCRPFARFYDAFGFTKRHKCMDFIDSEYKYFMAFENTLCLDYVTEKSLQRIIHHFIVPVVRSNGNHTIYHPPGSIVDVRHFRSAESLARFLNDVDIDQYKVGGSGQMALHCNPMEKPWYL